MVGRSFYIMMINLLKEYLKENGYSRFDLKAVIFDMDGVLYDSMPDHDLSWKETMDEYGLKYEHDEFYMQEGRIGTSTINTVIRRNLGRDATEEEMESIYARKSELFRMYNNGSILPGSKETLDYVQKKGLTPVLVTGSGQPSLLERIGTPFPGVFTPETMVTAFNVENGKPHPEPFLKGLEFGGNLSPNQAIVVENAPLGIEAAVGAGIFTIAVNTGLLNNNILLEAGAAIVYDSMTTVSEKLPEIIQLAQAIEL